MKTRGRFAKGDRPDIGPDWRHDGITAQKIEPIWAKPIVLEWMPWWSMAMDEFEINAGKMDLRGQGGGEGLDRIWVVSGKFIDFAAAAGSDGFGELLGEIPPRKCFQGNAAGGRGRGLGADFLG